MVMGCLAFQQSDGMAVAQRADRPTPIADCVPPVADRLTPLEWSVVAIARRDRRSTLRRPGRLSVAIRMLFGRPNPMLADVRLEALRRMAVLTWRDGYTVPSREVRTFLAAGFTPGQYETLVDRISAAHMIPPRTVGLRDREPRPDAGIVARRPACAPDRTPCQALP